MLGPMRLVEIFGDRVGGGDRRIVALEQGWRDPFGGERQERLPPLPRPLLDQLEFEPVLGQHESDEAGMRTEGMMDKSDHLSLYTPRTAKQLDASMEPGRLSKG